MSQVYLRKAEWKDVDLLFEWANDSDVRMNSFNTAPIDYEGHKCWFKNCLRDESIAIYICCLDTQPIGQVRVYYNNESVTISCTIDEKYRGQGFEAIIIKLVETEVVFTWNNIKFLFSNVKLDDIALQRIFEDNGYHKGFIGNSEEYINYCKKIDLIKANVDRYITIENNGGGGVLFLTNNRNALKLYDWLLHHEQPVYLYSGKLTITQLKYMDPNIIVSYNYKYIIKQDIILYMQGRIINLHISYLPWNKGANPNFWSFIDNTPKGVTIHKVDAGLDTGDILCQKLVEFDEEQETFRTSYERLNNEITEMFIENWHLIKTNAIKANKQENIGTYHTKLDFKNFTEIYPVNWDENIAEYKRRIARHYDRNKG